MKMQAERESWTGKFGFIMAAAGSAIGLGNIWKFPYMVGTSGGAVFLIAYVIFLFLLGVPVMTAEISVGRFAGMNAVDSCRRISEKWQFVGWVGLAGAFAILSYYSVVGGWVIKYALKYLRGVGTGDTEAYFTGFVSKTGEPVLLHIIFLLMCALIVLCGVSAGIERVSKILLPLLFVLLVVTAAFSLSLPNAEEGVRFFLVPRLSDIDSWGSVLLNAMGQVFFSLSLGMGTLITYGSYLKKDSNIRSSAYTIIALDSIAAVLSGFAVMPAVFSVGLEPKSGPGLLFLTLPAVFDSVPFGRWVAVAFFLLVLLAAVTSAISLMEVLIAFLTGRLGMKRISAVILLTIVLGITGAISSLSNGILSDMLIFGMTFFDFMSFLSDKIIMPMGGLLMCLLVGYVWGIPAAANEITNGGKLPFKGKKLFSFVIRYVSPALIIIVFVSSFF